MKHTNIIQDKKETIVQQLVFENNYYTFLTSRHDHIERLFEKSSDFSSGDTFRV